LDNIDKRNIWLAFFLSKAPRYWHLTFLMNLLPLFLFSNNITLLSGCCAVSLNFSLCWRN
jgi:hypothetical protein